MYVTSKYRMMDKKIPTQRSDGLGKATKYMQVTKKRNKTMKQNNKTIRLFTSQVLQSLSLKI